MQLRAKIYPHVPLPTLTKVGHAITELFINVPLV